MNIKLIKAGKDLLIHPGRTVIIYLALVIGLWGVGSVIVSYRILRTDLNRNFRMTIPPQAVITFGNDLAGLELSGIRKRPEIEKAEFRDLSSMRIEARPGDWVPLWLFGVENFKSFALARFFDQGGFNGDPAAPGDGEMVFERDGLKFTRLKAGISARIRSGERIVHAPIAGVVFDPAQAPGTQDHMVYGYVNQKTFSRISGQPVNRRLIVRFKEMTSKAEVQAAADGLVDYLISKGAAVHEVRIPKFNEHPHQWQLNTLLSLGGIIGFLGFLMGAVLVSQLLAAILASQMRQIGILKALGATRLQVFQIYLAMVLALGALSSTVAIPLAVISGYAYAYFVAAILNFQVLTKTLPFLFYLFIIATGLLLPLLLSLPALLKGTGRPVNCALNDYGLGPEVWPSKSVAAKIPLPTWLALALRNTLRRKGRLAVTVATMALGVAIFYAGFNVQQSLKSWLAVESSRMKHDVQVVLGKQVPAPEALRYFEGIDNVDRVETWSGGRGAMQSKVVATDEGVGIIALPWATDLLAFRSIQGRWLKNPSEPEIVMNGKAAEFYGNGVVDSFQTISIKGRKLKARLVGIVDELDEAKVYMDENLYSRMVNQGHRINSLMFVAREKSYDKVMELKRNIEDAVVSSDLPVLYVMMQAERVKIIYDHLYIILVTIVFLALLVLVVSAMGMASATSINIIERTREIGVLRAIGATPGIIYRLFVSEGMIVSLISIGIGLLLSWPLSVVAAGFFGDLMLETPLRLAFSYPGLVITLITTIAFGWLASRFPARKAIRISTLEALTFG